ncbi:response regulator [Lachnospiraceae bacterium ZAX-1]
MINILLVEDEPPILRDLSKQIKELSSFCCLFSTTTNGKAAMEIVDLSFAYIDLIITDIQMPVVDGLELIAYVKGNYPKISCIILSGFNDFRYAQKAIGLGVDDYLLKPVQFEDLKDILAKKYKEIIKTKISAEISNDSHDTPVINSVPKMPQQSQLYISCILCLGLLPHYHSFISPYLKNIWDLGIRKSLEHLDEQSTISYVIADGKTLSEKNIIIALPANSSLDIRALLVSFYENLDFKIPHTLIVNPCIDSITYIGDSIHELRKALFRTIILGRSQLLFITDINSPKENDNVLQLKTDVSNLHAIFKERSFSVFKAEFLYFISELEKEHLNQTILFDLLYSLMFGCLRDRDISISSTNAIEYISDALYLSNNYKELSGNILSMLEDIYRNAISFHTDTDSQEKTLYKIDSYIRQHFHEQINTQSIAQYFNFSPAYLSKLFREYKNISPTDYITELRILKAKKIMSHNPSLKIKDISLSIGYEDSLYFSKVFKKQTGLSPSQFMRQISQLNFSDK